MTGQGREEKRWRRTDDMHRKDAATNQQYQW